MRPVLSKSIQVCKIVTPDYEIEDADVNGVLTITVTDTDPNGEGVNTITNVEILEFADQHVFVGTTKNQIKFWDGTDDMLRSEPCFDREAIRIVQYDSCRGLEGWTVFNYEMDEFWDYKFQSFSSQNLQSDDLYTTKEELVKLMNEQLTDIKKEVDNTHLGCAPAASSFEIPTKQSPPPRASPFRPPAASPGSPSPYLFALTFLLNELL